MGVSKANAEWKGTLKGGQGIMHPANGSDVPFSFTTRFEGAKGSNPEEMIGAALAGCFSMALSADLERAGITPEAVSTTADVHLEKDADGFKISRIDLATRVAAKGDADKITSVANETKKKCPIARSLTAQIELTVTLAT